jgi:hypothetical protein
VVDQLATLKADQKRNANDNIVDMAPSVAQADAILAQFEASDLVAA